MTLTSKKVILWTPAFILAVTSILIVILLVTSNSRRLTSLEEANNDQTITFTFNQGASRFRIICKEDSNNPTFYICSTIRLGPTPTPTPTPSST